MRLVIMVQLQHKTVRSIDSDRSINSLPISSQMAESTVEHLVAERFKKKQKMAWIRDNAHNVLQVRSSLVGNTFNKYWKDMYGASLEIAA